MRMLDKTIHGRSVQLLEALILDEADLAQIRSFYTGCSAVQLELCALDCLELFQNITTLVLTGGLATEQGLSRLYRLTGLQELVLDYEETDSDEDAIDLGRFPALGYVLTRSNLNICGTAPAGCTVEIVNYYQNGRPLRMRKDAAGELYAVPGRPLLRQEGFLFCSAEAKSPAGPLLMDILGPLQQQFSHRFRDCRFSEQLDRIYLIPLCFPSSVVLSGAVRRRCYVSPRRRYAELRLFIPYEALMDSTAAERTALVVQNIESAAAYIAKKVPTFRHAAFLEAIQSCLPDSNP